MLSRAASALALTVCVLLIGCSGGSQPSGSAAPPTVGVVTLNRQTVPVIVTLPGRAVASREAEIRPRVDGVVQELAFDEGGNVKAGDLLYQIDQSSYQAALDSAKAALQKAEAAVPSSEAKLRRYEELAGVKGVSEQDLEDARATLAEAVADVSAAQADLATAQINLDYTSVTAPISGSIGASSVTEGALVTADQTDALATIRQLDPIHIDLTESSVNLLKFRRMLQEGELSNAAQQATVRLILEDGTTYDRTGTISFAESNVDESTGSFTVRARFANPNRLVLPGSFVRADVTLPIEQRAFLVPQRAVNHNTKGDATAMFVTADGKAETRTLQTLRAVGNSWVVESGISDGDRLIVEGLQAAHDGDEVTANEVTLDADGLITPQPGSSSEPSAALSLRGTYGGG